MKKLASIAVMLLMAAGASAQVTSHTQIKSPPLRSFSMPQPKRIALPNGMVIFIQEDHELPLIKGSATIRGGSRNVPAAKAGLTTIYGQAWRTGGTATRSGDELDEMLEARAARLETGSGSDSSSVSMDVLKGDLDTVFPLWVDLLRNPAFRQEKIELAKTQANTAISRRNDEPGGILAREVTRLGYGPNSPYARQAEYATIASITRDDLLAFHKQTVHPNNIILAFIGDFNAAQMEQRLRAAFSSWPRGPQVTIPDPAMTPAKPGIYFVAKEDVTQANIAMVHPGAQRNSPDAPAITVANEVLSGGFSGRLMQQLRSVRGLTYGAGGGVAMPWDYPGLFRVQMSTKSGTTLESIDALRGEVRRMIDSPATAAELSLAKESILNAFVFTMDTREIALQQQVLLVMYGFPADYYQKWPALIEKVTAADVARVAKTYLRPDQLAVLVVGNEKEFEKPLSTLGTVTPIDISIPAADAGQQKAAPSASNPEGMALVQKVRDFVGGAAIGSINASRTVASMSMQTPQGAMSADATTIVQYPSSMRQEMVLPMGTMTTVITPSTAFMITPMGTQDLPSSRRDAAVTDMKTDFMHILRNLDNPKYTFTAGATEKIGNVDARIIDISPEGGSVRWYVNPATGELLRTIRNTQGGGGPATNVTDYSEWKQFGAIKAPTVATVTRNGEKA
ncbi:MAG TPA: pitrilysin family protein, partial [Thermoanaerobaculia bacterium]|nr:pitrilysin family protein [Thermoanaerobaculia bacterium]